MVSRSNIYREAIEILKGNGIPDSEFDVMCIFQDVFEERNPMFLPLENVSEEREDQIRGMIKGVPRANRFSIYLANGTSGTVRLKSAKAFLFRVRIQKLL